MTENIENIKSGISKFREKITDRKREYLGLPWYRPIRKMRIRQEIERLRRLERYAERDVKEGY